MRLARMAPLALVALAGCHHEATLSADQAWIRLPAVAGHPGAGYLAIHGGPVSERLLAVESPAAGSTELHESMTMGAGGMTGMQRLDGINVPANGTVRFAPGGNHVMMFGLGPSLKAGGTTSLTVRFAKAPPLTIEARIVGAGDAAPY